MKNLMKRELIGDVLNGILLAATFAAALPVDALADLAAATNSADSSIVKPALHVVGLISYGLGTVMVVTGIAAAKKHADAPSNNPLGPAVGRLGAGAAFLAAPAVIKMIQDTGTATTSGNSTFQGIGF